MKKCMDAENLHNRLARIMGQIKAIDRMIDEDVPCEDIVDKAIETDAAIIGLSALMTTTMMRMQDVIEICKAKGCGSKVIIGGACITQSFADEIGADGYSKDAADCVKLVENLLQKI